MCIFDCMNHASSQLLRFVFFFYAELLVNFTNYHINYARRLYVVGRAKRFKRFESLRKQNIPLYKTLCHHQACKIYGKSALLDLRFIQNQKIYSHDDNYLLTPPFNYKSFNRLDRYFQEIVTQSSFDDLRSSKEYLREKICLLVSLFAFRIINLEWLFALSKCRLFAFL